jgi:formiminotetrahydrofolate cyclodeaminase
MEMAAVASNALAAMDGCKHLANQFLLSDLAIAASLAHVTARAARSTLQANAREITHESQRESLLADIDRILLHCAARQASIEAYVERHLEAPD